MEMVSPVDLLVVSAYCRGPVVSLLRAKMFYMSMKLLEFQRAVNGIEWLAEQTVNWGSCDTCHYHVCWHLVLKKQIRSDHMVDSSSSSFSSPVWDCFPKSQVSPQNKGSGWVQFPSYTSMCTLCSHLWPGHWQAFFHLPLKGDRGWELRVFQRS